MPPELLRCNGTCGTNNALGRRSGADYLARTGRTEIRAGVAVHAEPFYRAIGYRLIRRALARGGGTYLEMTHILAILDVVRLRLDEIAGRSC